MAMFFHLYLTFNASEAENREQWRTAAETYWAENATHFILRGAIMSDNEETDMALVAFMKFDDLEDTKSFLTGDPWYKAGVYKEKHITRWTNGLKRTPVTLPYNTSKSYWHLRGYGKPNTHTLRQEILQDHIRYYNPYDAQKILIRGALLKSDVDEWQGSAIVMEMTSRDEIKMFLAEEPYFVNGLYEQILIEKFRFQSQPS
jgi:uncharacterized protein YciI